MHKLIPFILPLSLFGAQLDPRYCISYGQPDASTHVVEYFSFACPQCARLFLKEFDEVRTTFLNSGRVHWTFHPVPVDLTTVQAMACLERLSEAQKRIFLEEMLTAASQLSTPGLTVLMQRILDLLDVEGLTFDDPVAFEKTRAFLAAYDYVKDGVDVEGVPTASIDGEIFPNDMPSVAFLRRMIH